MVQQPASNAPGEVTPAPEEIDPQIFSRGVGTLLGAIGFTLNMVAATSASAAQEAAKRSSGLFGAVRRVVGDFGQKSGIVAYFEKIQKPGWYNTIVSGGAKTSSFLASAGVKTLPATLTVADKLVGRIIPGAAIGDSTMVGDGVAGLGGTAAGATIAAGGLLLLSGVGVATGGVSLLAVTSVGAAVGGLGGSIARDLFPQTVGYVTDEVVGKAIVSIAPDWPGKRELGKGIIASRDWALDQSDAFADAVNPYVGGWVPKVAHAPAR